VPAGSAARLSRRRRQALRQQIAYFDTIRARIAEALPND
jgi:hypothetical protein